MTSSNFQLTLAVAAIWAITVVLAAGLLRLFERQLTWSRALRIVSWAFGISTAILLAYWVVSFGFKLSDSADSMAAIAWLVLTGALITRRARRDGIQKAAVIGAGGKVMLCVTLLMWLAGIVALMAVYPSV